MDRNPTSTLITAGPSNGAQSAAAAQPSDAQRTTAAALGIDLPENIPATVAAVVLKQYLSDVLLEDVGRAGEIPDALLTLEDDLEIGGHAALVTGSRAEVSAWFAARYMVMTARGLRSNRPGIGDVVTSSAWPGEQRVISSIGDDGRVYMKGRPARKAWPNHLQIVERVGEPGYAGRVAAIRAALLNGASYKLMDLDRLEPLREFKLASHVPSPEAIRALEELLESGERREEPFQVLLTRYPSLLAATVVGGWRTYVIPKQRLGAEHVPDFLVLGINSLGPQWLMVEIEATRHPIVNKDDTLSGPTRHAIKQIQDWSEWLTVVPPESWRASLCGFPVEGRGVLVADGAHHARRAVPAVVVVEPVAPVQDNSLRSTGVLEFVA